VEIIGMTLATDVDNLLKDPISKFSYNNLHYYGNTGLVGSGMAKMAAMKAYKEAGNLD